MTDSVQPIRVAVVDDENLIASSLATLLSLEVDIDVVLTCSTGEELVEWARVHSVDVCVVDLHMPGLDGAETTAQLQETEGVTAGVVIVTSHAHPDGMQRALEAGAQGFIPKTSSAQEFATAIRTVHAGRRYVDSQVATAALVATQSPLTAREKELLVLVPSGMSIEQLASSVHLAPGTVRNYLSSAMRKTGAANRFGAYRLAAEQGWV